jgi:hypothetical protein
MRESGMEAASAAISQLGFKLDLMVHRVLMHMHGGARHGVVVLARGRLELETGWERAHQKWTQGCGEATTVGVRVTGRRRGNGVNPDPSHSIYRGSTASSRCGSFRCTTRFNVSILINTQEDCVGFITNRLSQT